MTFDICIYSFTNKGRELAKTIAEYSLEFRKNNAKFVIKEEFSEEDFNTADALIFIGAMGIAVRKIAPYIKSKMSDPAVIVIDENAKNVIPVLSGHIGGANELSIILSKRLNSNACITTATDINLLPAIDEIAYKNHFEISNRDGIVKINSRILNGEKISICGDADVVIDNPNEHFTIIKYDRNKAKNSDIIISSDVADIDRCELHIFNKKYVLGVGCRKNIDVQLFEQTVLNTLTKIADINDICYIASIDLKKDEQGIVEFSKKYNIPFVTYTAKELDTLEGDFSYSDFVLETTGVSNVSERAAAYDKSGKTDGEFVIKQVKESGITISLYKKIRRFDFGG